MYCIRLILVLVKHLRTLVPMKCRKSVQVQKMR